MIRSKPSTDTYRENWERIFGEGRWLDAAACAFCGELVDPKAWTCPTCWPETAHPPAD